MTHGMPPRPPHEDVYTVWDMYVLKDRRLHVACLTHDTAVQIAEFLQARDRGDGP